jgi:hypothetical protein
MMQHNYATAYLFAGRLVLHSHLQTPYGLFACRPFVRVDGAAAPLEEVGQAVLAAINALTLCTRA